MNQCQTTRQIQNPNAQDGRRRGEFTTLVANLAIEYSLWLFPACGFLLASILVFDNDNSVIAPHLWTVFRFALGLTALRLLAARKYERICIVFYGLAFSSLLMFYALTLGGYTQKAAAQVDIAPTVLSELGLPIPYRWQGKPLDKISSRDYVLFEHNNEFGLIDFTNQDSRWKYWLNRKSGQEFAFDLLTDPGETNNLIASIEPSRRAVWRDRLRASATSTPLK